MLKRFTAILLVLMLALSVAMPAMAAASYRRIIKEEMTGDDVQYMQERLAYYGYYTGKVDGKFGGTMKKAVYSFQVRNKLKADCMIGKATWSALTADDSVKRSDPKFELLKLGSSGEKVKAVQQALKKWHYYPNAVTGKFDVNTKRAVTAFQASASIKQDGIVGETTYDRLINETARILKSGAIPARSMGPTSRGQDVYIAQKKLISLNYLKGSPSGYYNGDTTAAVKKFQANNGLKATGTLDKDTRRYLWPTQMDDQTMGSGTSGQKRPILKKGSHGKYVSTLQMRLKSAGYMYGAVDAVFGDATDNAVQLLQRRYGLKQDGVVGTETWKIVDKLNTNNAEQEVIDPGKESVGTPTGRIEMGAKGTAVKKIQRQLIQASFLAKGEDDGVFGRRTRAAVCRLQRAEGLKVDGIVGTQTLISLEKLSSK